MEPHQLRYFEYKHLKNERLKIASRPFCELALWVQDHFISGEEKSACLRKLLEAKDCAVRAAL